MLHFIFPLEIKINSQIWTLNSSAYIFNLYCSELYVYIYTLLVLYLHWILYLLRIPNYIRLSMYTLHPDHNLKKKTFLCFVLNLNWCPELYILVYLWASRSVNSWRQEERNKSSLSGLISWLYPGILSQNLNITSILEVRIE